MLLLISWDRHFKNPVRLLLCLWEAELEEYAFVFCVSVWVLLCGSSIGKSAYEEVSELSFIRVREKAFYTSLNHLIEQLIKTNAANKARKRNRILSFLLKNEVLLGCAQKWNTMNPLFSEWLYHCRWRACVWDSVAQLSLCTCSQRSFPKRY